MEKEQTIENKAKQTSSLRLEKLNEYLRTSQQKSYFVAAVTTIFFVLFMVLGVIPAFRSVLSQSEENGVINEAIKNVNLKISDMQKMVSEFENNAQTITLFEQLFPGENDQAAITQNIYSQALSDQIFIKSVNFPEGKRQQPLGVDFGVIPTVQSAQVVIRAEGQIGLLQKFLRTIEDSKRIYNVTSVTIERKKDEALNVAGFEREYDIIIIMEYFYFDPSAVTTGVSSF